MRSLFTLSAVGTTTLDLGEVEFIGRGQRVIIAGGDSVATATLRITLAGNEVFNGPLPIEPSTDALAVPGNILTQFIAAKDSKMIATLGGTVAGARVNFYVLAPGEPTPW